MRIGVVGTGPMNVLLASSWAGNRHGVCIGSRSRPRAQAVASRLRAEIRNGDYADAAQFGEVVFFAVDPDIAVDTAEALCEQLAGKVVIDATNPYRRGSQSYPAAAGRSLAERIAAAAPQAHIVKAFNVLRAQTLRNVLMRSRAKTLGQYVSVFFCGDDAAARRTVSGLIHELFLDPIDCGGLEHAYQLEALAGLSMFLTEKRFDVDAAINVTRKRESSPLDAWM